MFGLFVSKIVKASAERLMMQLGIIQRKYALVEDSDLLSYIAQDFDQHHYLFEGSSATIAPNETPYFQFRIAALLDKEKGREVVVFGRDVFRGFMMTAASPKTTEWLATAPSELVVPPTRDAVALVSYLDRQYGVIDADKMSGSFFTASRYLAKRQKRLG